MPDPGGDSTPGDPGSPTRPAPWERRLSAIGRGRSDPDDSSVFAPLDDDRPATRPRDSGQHLRCAALLTGKLLVTSVAALVFVVTALGWVTTELLDAQLRTVSALDPDSDAVIDPAGQLGDQNYLIVGSDTRIGAQPAGAGTTEVVAGARADTIMITHVPADRSRVVVVSIPRDIQISRPPCQVWDPRTGRYTGTTDPGAEIAKINSAYAVGGPRCLTRVVQQISGLHINHFLAVDFRGFQAMVAAVGGVRVCVERPLTDAELGVIIPEPGYATISGDTALDFVRARKVVGDPTGGYGRITRQQHFLSALLRETMSAEVLFSPSALRDVVAAVTANTIGDNVDASTLLRLAHSLQGLDPSAVTFVTAPTTGEANRYGNEVLRRDDTAALFRAIIDGTPLPDAQAPTAPPAGPSSRTEPAPRPGTRTGSSATPPAPRPAPSEVRIRVLNGSGITGQAAAGARALRAVGFGVVDVGNADERVESTVIRYGDGRRPAARTVAMAVPEAPSELDPTLDGAIVLVLGPDFDGTVTEVPEPGAAPSLPSDLTTVSGADSACGSA
ncbi:MAG: LytR family transcriptional regulator [Pseudonocardiaceae bacterium]|nr:LytR family transcriptional regulator [Pseudonocardiaceae bacterium]